jgi:hypothetical protein
MQTPKGHRTQQALRWVASELARDPSLKRSQLISQASQRFDLTPMEADFLLTQPLPPPDEPAGEDED